MQHGSHLGPSVVVKGEISATEPITISGRVEGTIDASGQVVTIDAGAHVTAGVAAGTIVVSGTVHGSLVAEERIALRAGAEVDGDMTAPRLAVEDGASVRGAADIAGPADGGLKRAS